MPNDTPGDTPDDTKTQTARVDFRLGSHLALKAEVHVTPAGLLAIGGLVSAILLSVAPLVLAARYRLR